MLNRDTDCPVEDRNFLHDLSSFEMKKTTLDTNSNEKSLDYAGVETDEAQVIGGHYDNVNLIAECKTMFTKTRMLRLESLFKMVVYFFSINVITKSHSIFSVLFLCC